MQKNAHDGQRQKQKKLLTRNGLKKRTERKGLQKKDKKGKRYKA